MTLFHITWTIVMFFIFIAIVLWAFSKKRKHDFDVASVIPLEDETTDENVQSETEKFNG